VFDFWKAAVENDRDSNTQEIRISDRDIADPPILSSSPRNGSGTAMNADLSLVEQSDSSACPARSLQNVPVRPPIAQSTPSFFCTFLRISQKISISQRLQAGCSLDTEGIGRKSQEKEGSRFCTEVAVGEPIGRLIFVLSSCLPLRLTNRWPVPQEPYRQEPFLVDEDRIGGSAILWHSSRCHPPAARHAQPPPPSPIYDDGTAGSKPRYPLSRTTVDSSLLHGSVGRSHAQQRACREPCFRIGTTISCRH